MKEILRQSLKEKKKSEFLLGKDYILENLKDNLIKVAASHLGSKL